MATATKSRAVYDRLYIGGEWVRPHSGRMIESIEPATGRVWAEVAEADEVDVDRAVHAARLALESGPWPQLSATERGHLLRRLADLLAEHAERLAVLEARDSGKVIREARGEVGFSVQSLLFHAGYADKLRGESIPIGEHVLVYTRREPVGVVGAITPWNSPILMYAWKIGPCLAAGNTMVLKPAELTPVTAMEIARLAETAGIPPGVLNVVPGYGHLAGATLTRHPDVNKIAFTGEHSTAQEILKAASGNLKRLSFECGGKAPFIVFPDANFEKAIRAALAGGFVSCGQSCSLGSRIFLHEEIHDSFLAEFARRAERIRYGDPLDPQMQMGSQVSQQQLDKTMYYVKSAKQAGARAVIGGERPGGGLANGYFYKPTILAGVDNSMDVAQNEVFGPVLSVIKFQSEDEVVAAANDVRYGLTAGIWTQDISRAHRLAARIKAGLVWVNQYRAHHWAQAYGGFKMSGWGRENGTEVYEHYTEVKTVHVDLREEIPDPYAD